MKTHLHGLLLYCRPGFERECAQEIVDRCGEAGHMVEAQAESGGGWVEAKADGGALWALTRVLRWRDLCFARQLLWSGRTVSGMNPGDRVTPVVEAARELCDGYADFLIETPDTDHAKSLSATTRKLEPHMARALEEAGAFSEQPGAPRLHILFVSADTAIVALSFPDRRSEWLNGIPRLRMPREAPSRSTLKLAEAFHTLLDEGEQERLLKPGMTAVDLGAAPGGWTWQLVSRHIHVTAVDNGRMNPALLESGLVIHKREDGFRFVPRKPVDWLVCDMVEQPRRIAQLVARWITTGLCRHAVFNLKLPMKRRYEEWQLCSELIREACASADLKVQLRSRQLYHDREEVTCYLGDPGKPGGGARRRKR
ncbi:23S rRNA (cytidine(2498)-2'-O)-methyltransferase RlmM [Methyloversatilis thermotolerans]|uniref:23S rRNA (cytidine(2498)-2'-O)-methyltransferase RlmM n=1 Tax=Methyloversatilis thermotolerans TaxID=1346290 RepID=UPI00036CA641|nr:23S rRNA (cytidine(2498)-2'-O)-methyltransferase RlmM [Methyloversatilis thermotolerans]